MTFPTMTNTWKFSRVGLTNVIPLPQGGGPYTIGMDKASAGYTAQLFWSPNLDASPLDDSWKPLSDLNTTDEVDVPASIGDVRAIMGSITAIPAGANIAKCEISIATANAKGAQNQRRHASGYGANLIGGAAPVQDEYAALILADMGVTNGSFFSMQDDIVTPLTDSGPTGIADMVDDGGGSGVSVVGGPWEGTKARFSVADMAYFTTAFDTNLGVSELATFECWARTDVSGATATIFWLSAAAGGNVHLEINATNNLLCDNTPNSTENPADPGAWAASTAYSIGDRVRPVSDDFNIIECEVAGTSDGTTEPTWPAQTLTVVDNDITWRQMGFRSGWHDMNADIPPSQAARISRMESSAQIVTGKWFHCAYVRTTLAWEIYINGVKVDDIVLAEQLGQNGVKPRVGNTVDYNHNAIRIGAAFMNNDAWTGAFAYVAHYWEALTPAQLLAHYNKGVELGLN